MEQDCYESCQVTKVQSSAKPYAQDDWELIYPYDADEGVEVEEHGGLVVVVTGQQTASPTQLDQMVVTSSWSLVGLEV